ncbi:MAG: tetratricopeptide repeat protein [Saprospiraceae bacterium]|nr:tetratricopeptide repeat protein [Saprospiraceae bacterium]
MTQTKLFIYSAFALGAILLLFCSRDIPLNQPNTYLNLQDSVVYVGMQTCRSCHDNIHQTFIHTGMGRSFDHATLEKSDATYGKHALVYDEKSNFYYRPYFAQDSLFIDEFRLDGKDTVHLRTEKISYIVGSGQHTNSHILDINGYIYQAPITYYTQEKRWDMAPGFRVKKNERFARFLTTECLTCHNHFPEHIEGSINKYSEMPTGIECERCHGPGEIHVREKLAGNIVDTSQFIDYTIVNPRDLSRDLQMDLCQRCHLQGIAVLEDDKTFYDFKPGMKLKDVFNVFLPRYTNSHEKFIMASQADRMRLSKCYQLSDMTCITCHNPHVSIEATGIAQYNKACENCHQGNNNAVCSLAEAERIAEGNDCSACHMPPSGSIDIPHINITDHYISKENVKGRRAIDLGQGSETNGTFLGLQILTKDNPTPLDMARGYIALFDKYLETPIMLDSAFFYLQRSNASMDKKWKTWIHYYFARADYEQIIRLVAQDGKGLEEDAWTAYRIGDAYYNLGDFAKAKQFFAQATSKMPYQLDFQEKLGTAQIQLKDYASAKKTFEFVLSEHPKRQIALSNLGLIYVINGDFPKGEELYDKAIALDPDYEQAILNKAAARLAQNDISTGQQLLERVLKINPQNEQAKWAMSQIISE